MNWWSRVWEWVVAPTGSMLTPRSWLVVLASLAVMGVGAFVAEVSEARRTALVARFFGGRGRSNTAMRGPSEYGLHADLWRKSGVGLAVWATALALSIVLRTLATEHLMTHLLTALVLATAPLFISGILVYRLVVFPRYVAQCRRADVRRSYRPTTQATAGRKGQKSARAAQPSSPPISATPWQAVVGAASAPLVYYAALVVHTGAHDMHQVGMLVAALLGYLIGLTVSFGDGVRTGAFWAHAH